MLVMARAGLFTWKLSAIFGQKSAFGSLICTQKGTHQFIKFFNFTSLTKTNLISANESESESDSDNENSKPDDFTDLKLKILEASLKFVPEYGWSKQSIALGADSIGLSPASHTLIQDSGADLVHYLNFSSNEKLKSYLSKQYSLQEKKIDIQSYVEDALETRLKMVIPYASKWPEAMALMLSPFQLSTNSKNLLDLVGIIWHHSGDKSLDLTWYSKRIALGAVYRMCELSLCQDKSLEYSNTFEFLQRRVENVILTNDCITQIAECNKHLPEFATAALITVRNVFGVNRWLR